MNREEEKIQKRINKHQKKISELAIKLQHVCTHDMHTVEIKGYERERKERCRKCGYEFIDRF